MRVKINWLSKLPNPFDDQHMMWRGGAYSADAAGTARVSQEHRCAPHRTSHPSRSGSMDGFKLMTLHMPIATTLRTKQKSLLRCDESEPLFSALDREKVATNLTPGTLATQSGHDPHHPSHAYYTNT